MMSLLNTVHRRSIPLITKTLIVCGDCSGDELLPLKTLLTADGRCAACGGRNYVLAAYICNQLAQHLIKQGEKQKC